MHTFTLAITFTIQVWIANGAVAVQHDPQQSWHKGWSVPVEFGDRIVNTHHAALSRLNHAHKGTKGHR